MKPVTIYTRALCPYCWRAVKLLKKKGVKFTEIDVGMDSARRAEMIKRANGGSTVPQIFIGDLHIGGCDDMVALEQAGKLDRLLQG